MRLCSGCGVTPGIASLDPGLVSVQPFRAAGLHAVGVKEITPGERSVASHRGLVNPGETHAGGVRGEIRRSATAPPDFDGVACGPPAGYTRSF